MADKTPPTDNEKALFSSLIVMLASSAMQQLGKLVNPVTQKAELNLEAAQMTIDLLEMLRNRTSGNLDADETRMLGEIISSLQMNYVQTALHAPKADDGKPETAESPRPANPAADATPAADKAKADEKSPRYHKSYGD